MSIDPRYLASKVLQQYLVDNRSGLPLAGGQVYFYRDADKVTPKPVYTISGNGPDYTFIELPNPCILSSVGTFQYNGNDIIPYYYPYLDDGTTLDLYYVVVQNYQGADQFTRAAWPPDAAGSEMPTPTNSVLANIIPNGQFLLHNNLVATDNEAQAGSNIIAQGGWTFELTPDVLLSDNTVEFIAIPNYVSNPPQSPPFQVQIVCLEANPADTVKSLRIKFNDVNKFANGRDYSFGFSAFSQSSLNVLVNIVKYFGVGGTPFTPQTQAALTITPDQQFFSTVINFGTNAGSITGTGQTYCAIDIAFPTSVQFTFTGTDFLLFPGNINLTTYPAQTNADTVTRANDGWTDIPDYNGLDLYLPKVQTMYGYKYDTSQIGKVEATTFPVISPLSTMPLPESNEMPADGASYIYDDVSTIGIPFSRYGAKLIANSPVPTIPLFGTGANFATAYASANPDILRLTVNSSGTPSAAAVDDDTAWAIGSIVTYGASVAGSASINYTALSNVANTVLAVGNFVTPKNAALTNTSGFTVNTLLFTTGLLAQQKYAITILCVAGSALVNGAGVGKYWTFSSQTGTGVDYYMWFSSGSETDPAIAGRTGIKVIIGSGGTSAYSAQDISNIVREVMNAYQISTIIPTALPAPGQFWKFSTNPPAPIQYYVWYTVDGDGVDPDPGGIGLEVALVEADLPADIVSKTQAVVNQYQYAAPDFRGMVLRGLDPLGTWDKDVAQRWSSISGLSGAFCGTYEFQQFLSHVHTYTLVSGGGNSVNGSAPNVGLITSNTGSTGGSETRMVNAAVNFYIRY
jgi:hypothetical protein